MITLISSQGDFCATACATCKNYALKLVASIHEFSNTLSMVCDGFCVFIERIKEEYRSFLIRNILDQFIRVAHT